MSVQSDLLDLAPVQALESDAEHAPLYELLTIFLLKTVEAYIAWEKKHGALLQKLGKDLTSVLPACLQTEVSTVRGVLIYPPREVESLSWLSYSWARKENIKASKCLGMSCLEYRRPGS